MNKGLKFQFHKGSIQTAHQPNQVAPMPYFNSIKVQFKPETAEEGVIYFGHFNSIKVQFKLTVEYKGYEINI